jgi:hypothetical protein
MEPQILGVIHVHITTNMPLVADLLTMKTLMLLRCAVLVVEELPNQFLMMVAMMKMILQCVKTLTMVP